MLGFFDKYPYTDFHELNLDWLISTVKLLTKEMHDFELVNKITFEGTWSIAKQYKPFSIVTDGDAGYISTQPVPAGVQITNEDYWTLIADYSAIVGNLGARVTALENEVDDMKNGIQKRYILVGDSFSLGVIGGGSPQVTGWAEYAESHMPDYNEKAYIYHPEAHEPIEGVASFAGGLFLQYLQTIEGDLDCDNSEIDEIVVLGGSNEFNYSSATIISAIGQFCYYAREHFPNALIRIGLIGLQADRLYSDVYDAYVTGAKNNGAQYIRSCLNLMLNPVYDSGYGHITEAGYNFINPFVLQAIRFGECSYKYEVQNITATVGSDVTVEAGSFAWNLIAEITDKSIQLDLITTTGYNPYILKLNNKTGSGVSGTAFTLSNDVYFPISEVADADILIREDTGYQYSIVRKGHMYIDDHNKIKYSGGFPYYNTWSSAGIDNADNNCYIAWSRGHAHII